MRQIILIFAAFTISPALAAPETPPAIYTDPVRDAAHPARMEVLRIPSGDAEINGVAYLAAGAGPHPTIIICHGLPGNEKNLDLAQAVRRAGWNAITFNYRGSWGSAGSFRFAQNPQDAAAVLAYIRIPANARMLGIDTTRLVLGGHSMGGWVAALASGGDSELAGTILISAANLGARGHLPRADLVKIMNGNRESLAGTSAEIMADEIIANADTFNFVSRATPLSRAPLLVLSSDDGNAPMTDALVADVRKAGGKRVTLVHVGTDHSWSDSRIRLQAEVINWLIGLK